MKKKSQRIKSIIELKSIEEQKALTVFGESQKKLQSLQEQMKGLKSYRQEYLDKYKALGSNGTNIKQLLEFRSFMDKLDKAMVGQIESIKTMEAELARYKKDWEKLYYHIKNLQKICDAALADEINLADKKEQKELDEMVSRRIKGNPNNSI